MLAVSSSQVSERNHGYSSVLALEGRSLASTSPTALQPETDERDAIIVLFEPVAVSEFTARQASGSTGLQRLQQSRVRQYSRKLANDHQHFLDEIDRLGMNARLKYDFTYLVNGLALSIDRGDIDGLSAIPGISGIYADSPVGLDLSGIEAGIHLDSMLAEGDNQNIDLTGKGIRVAIIDTGIDYTHPDLGGCFGLGCKVVDGYDLYNNDPDPMDDGGHGTHCAGIIAANGTMIGVAPESSLLAYKVLDGNGFGSIAGMIAGMEWAADPDRDPGTDDAVDIMSLSLGYPGTIGDPWSLAVKAASKQGILVVVAAGNRGPNYSSLDSPGLEDKAFTVGASAGDFSVAAFSSRGPVPDAPALIKPSIVAPGVDILSTWLDGEYALLDGTSMAVPHAAGAAAQIMEARPHWTAAMVQANLMNTAVDLGANIHTQGAGLLNTAAAASAPAVITPGAVGLGLLDLGRSLWHISQTLWVTNVSSLSMDYDLSLSGPLSGGTHDFPISASLDKDQFSLAGGKSASVTLSITVAPSQIPPDLDRNEGVLLVLAGDTPLTVPFALQVPPLFIKHRVLPSALQSTYAVELADLDGDGDLDAFFGNTAYYNNPANTVWLNDGHGTLEDSGQRLGTAFTWSVALGDLDGDGDQDAFTANSEVWDAQPNAVWLNNGAGQFTDGGQRLGQEFSRGVALGDLDGDGDLDAFVANGDPNYGGGEPNSVWLNDGTGRFSDSGQKLGDSVSQDVALGDLDHDGDLDAFVANGRPERGHGQPNKIWLNNGQGLFSDSGQSLGDSISQAVILGELDGDSDIDAFVANGGQEVADGQPDRLWLNNGSALFTDSGQLLDNDSSYGAALADLYADGNLDIFVAGYHGGNKVWLNDGSAKLSLSSPGFAIESAADVALGDLDQDGDVDALVANAIGRENQLWLNRRMDLPEADQLAPPSDLQAAPVSPTEIALSWVDNALDESAYVIERSTDGANAWNECGTVPADTTTFNDTSLRCGSTYSYRVRAYRGSDGQYSAFSGTGTATTSVCEHAAYLPMTGRP